MDLEKHPQHTLTLPPFFSFFFFFFFSMVNYIAIVGLVSNFAKVFQRVGPCIS